MWQYQLLLVLYIRILCNSFIYITSGLLNAIYLLCWYQARNTPPRNFVPYHHLPEAAYCAGATISGTFLPCSNCPHVFSCLSQELKGIWRLFCKLFVLHQRNMYVLFCLLLPPCVGRRPTHVRLHFIPSFSLMPCAWPPSMAVTSSLRVYYCVCCSNHVS